MRNRLPVERFVVAKIAEYLRFPLKQLAPLKLKRANPPLCVDVTPTSDVRLFRDLVAAAPSDPPVAEPGEVAARVDDRQHVQSLRPGDPGQADDAGIHRDVPLQHRQGQAQLDLIQPIQRRWRQNDARIMLGDLRIVFAVVTSGQPDDLLVLAHPLDSPAIGQEVGQDEHVRDAQAAREVECSPDQDLRLGDLGHALRGLRSRT